MGVVAAILAYDALVRAGAKAAFGIELIAFGDEEAIQLLLDAGAKIDAKDANGDSPLSWASWHLRPTSILLLLCYGPHRVHPQRTSMREYLQGEPR